MPSNRFSSMPKVELHLHLEGAIPLDALWRLVVAHGGEAEVPTPEALEDRFRYRDFSHFIDVWVWKNGFLRTYDDFTFIAEAVSASLAAQNILYAEVFFSPSDFEGAGLEPPELAAAIRRGLDGVAAVEVALIVDLVRDTGPERALRTFDRIREVAGEVGIVGIGLGGSEGGFPAGLFVDVYRRAAEAGFRLTAHAGEAAGPESVWEAVRELGVERIGHGVRSVEDPALLRHLAETGIPLEVCPTSNVRTRVVASLDAHPIRELIDAGVTVTINTDDPAMFGCSLAGEYGSLAERFGLDDGALRGLSRNAVEASWAPEPTKLDLASRIDAWWNGAPGSS